MIVSLPEGAIMSIDLEQQQCLVQCREGRLWVTRTGDGQDYFLESGQESFFSGPGKTVIEAVTGASVDVSAESCLTIKVSENDSCAGRGFSFREVQNGLKSLWARRRIPEKAVAVYLEANRF